MPTQCESIDGCSVLIDHDADLMSIIASISEDTLWHLIPKPPDSILLKTI